jgi:Helix-turn-helix.
MALGENVRVFRERQGMTQTELAQKVRLRRHKVDRSYVSRVESGVISPPYNFVESLGRALRVPMWMLTANLGENVWFGLYLSLTANQKRALIRHIGYLANGSSYP